MKNYKLIQVAGEYIRNYNNAPYVRKPYSYYIQEDVSSYNYRGVKVYVKETLNKDKTHKGYVIVNISVKSKTPKLTTENVRSCIDGLFTILEEKILDKPMKCEYVLSKITDEEETIYERSISAMCSKKHSPLEKRYILGDLIKKGLSKIEALNYLDFLL